MDQQTSSQVRPSFSPWHAPTLLALFSGAPALVYEIVWTREVALVIGSQVEAISAVLAAFFGGLAIGAALLGPVADRVRSPLRLYGILEIVGGSLAIASPWLIRLIGEQLVGRLAPALVLALAATIVFVIAGVLGGTMPALVRTVTRDPRTSARASGRLVGVNTAGAVAGVVLGAALIPLIGLRVTITLAGIGGVLIGVVALVLPRVEPEPEAASTTSPSPDRAATAPMTLALLVALLGGVGTLAFQVLAARSTALILGSSLLAWALVLGLFLVGLSLGNLLAARRAANSVGPRTELGVIEVGAAVIVTLGSVWLVRSPATPATGPTPTAVAAIALWIVPATLLMGAAFPFYVRLTVRRSEAIAAAFGAVSAANTIGGIAGSLVGPFLLLPAFGLRGGLLVSAGLNGLLGLALVAWGAGDAPARILRPAIAAAVLVAAAAASMLPLRGSDGEGAPRVLHVQHGRQATAAVARVAGRRDLIVDGDPEASTGSNARVTEELLGTLPAMLHPNPRLFLEVGLGSGITLGTSATFPYDRLDCVEIADSVISCAPFFEPDNRGVASNADERVNLMQGDGRAFLLTSPATYDVIVANTLHPWSVGATGLYSREYFQRIRRALRPGGLTAQWLPLARLGADHLAAILRTFYGVFPEGELWWGAENLIVVGRVPGGAAIEAQLLRDRYADVATRLRRLDIGSFDELRSRRLADASTVLEVLGPGDVLTDDRPLLEAAGSLRRSRRVDGSELALVSRIVDAAAAERPELEGMRLWLRSGVARLGGDEAEALRLEQAAEAAGLELVSRTRARRHVLEGLGAFEQRRLQEAQRLFSLALEEDRTQAHARFGMAMIDIQLGRLDAARRHVEQLLTYHPDHAEGWNLLASLRQQQGDLPGADDALDQALAADPYFPEALANAGLVARRLGDAAGAAEMLRRLEALDPKGDWPETRALRAELEGS